MIGKEIVGYRVSSECRDAGHVCTFINSVFLAGKHGEYVFQDATGGLVLAAPGCNRSATDGASAWLDAGPRYAVAVHGELRNASAVRQELAASGHVPGQDNSLQLVAAAVAALGPRQALSICNGAFALAVWDRQSQELWLARDRFGALPVYYGWINGGFVFGTRLRTLRSLPGFEAAVDRGALSLYMRHSCVPAPYCIYRGMRQLLPGTLLRVDAALARSQPDDAELAGRCESYWSACAAAAYGAQNPLALDDAAAVAEMDGLLRESVALRVPDQGAAGAFLSGGFDSSLMTALLQAQSDKPVPTFAIGFEQAAYDEAEHAKAVARHLGTEHHELRVTAADGMAVIPQLATMYDQPFADASQIPTFLVSQLARRHVPVALGGDGGDELFAGYNRHFYGGGLRRWLDRVPHSLRLLLAGWLRRPWFAAALEQIMPWLPAGLRLQGPRQKVHKLVDMLAAASDEQRYRLLTSQWRDPAAVVLGGIEPPTLLTDARFWPASGGGGPDDRGVGAQFIARNEAGNRAASCAPTDSLDSVQRMVLLDQLTYLPDDGMTKVRGASRAAGLNVRAPMLDHRLAEFGWRLPMHQMVRDGQGKWLLRQVLYQYVPQALMERPKQGFGVPVGDWLRGPLRDWAEGLLDEQRLCEQGYFDPAPIRHAWHLHLDGATSETGRLWNVLMFQAWLGQL